MSLSFLAAAIATIAAAAGTGLLARDCVRLPRIEVAGWLVAAAGLTIALAAQAAGYSRGFGPSTFRAVQLGAQLLAPLALVWGLIEVTARSATARFAGRLVLAAVTIVAGVILTTDPLSSAPFTTAWPSAAAHYQIIPNGVLMLITVSTVIVAVVAATVAGVRSRREPVWREAFAVTAAGGAGVLVIQLLRMSLPLNAAYVAVCLITAGLAWFAGTRSDAVRLRAAASEPAHRGGYPGEEDDIYGGLYRQDDSGYRGYRDDTGYSEPGAGAGYSQPGADPGYGGYGGHDISDTGYGFYRDDTDGLRALSDTGYGLYRDDTGAMVFADGPAGPGESGAGDTGFGVPGLPGLPGADVDEEEGTARLYGQIAIYTLLDSRAADFDELAQDVVAKVKAREPETLVFVMHGVPSAPMQRILYEVYRDQAAYEHHAEQPYVRDFEERRKPYVLATNVIELGVRQAKVSPLGTGAAPPAPELAAAAPPPAPPRTADPGWSPRGAADRGGLSSRAPGPGWSPRGAADPGSSPARPGGPGPASHRAADQASHRAADPDRPSHRAADPGRPSRGVGEPGRSAADPSWSSRGGEPSEAGPSRSRRQSEPPSPRRAPEPPPPAPDGDFWTRPPPADTPEDDEYGDYWDPGSRYP